MVSKRQGSLGMLVSLIVIGFVLVTTSGCNSAGAGGSGGDGATYLVGHTGPGGGTVYYDDAVGYDFDDSGSIEDDEKDLLDGTNDGALSGDRFLEVAPADWSGGSEPTPQWGLIGTDTAIPNLTVSMTDYQQMSVGDGEPNTSILVAALSLAGESSRAAQLCDSYSGGGKQDWFLPTVGELAPMLDNKGTLGIAGNYWSSSEDYSDFTWIGWFGTSTYGPYTFGSDYDNAKVRPIRSF